MSRARPDTDTRQQVMTAAIRAFAASGYAGTSVQQILAATGLSKPTLYYYFGSKEGLFRALIDYAHDESHRRIEAAATGPGSCVRRLVRLTTALFEFAQAQRDLMRLVFSSTFAAPGEIPAGVIDAERRRRNFARVEQLVREGQAAGELDPAADPVELTHALFGAISHHVRMHLLEAHGDLGGPRAANLVDLFLNGARPPLRFVPARRAVPSSSSDLSHASSSPSPLPPTSRSGPRARARAGRGPDRTRRARSRRV